MEDIKQASKLSPEELLNVHALMLKSRLLEEKIIRMGKSGEGHFWIGGPGEEAAAIPLGLMLHKGKGIEYDFLHLHYRASGVLLAMGAEPIDTIRQMKSSRTDPYSGGRNFVNHYAVPEWNIVPVSSCIEPQYSQAIGTARAQRGRLATGITIVTGGDAGTAEGDFATAMVWASRPTDPLPLLMIVNNNDWGISTPYGGQHGETKISDRGIAFNIKSATRNGNDLFEAWDATREAIHYVRTERKPYLLELKVSRLYGHSSASGANFVEGEVDPLTKFQDELIKRKMISKEEIDSLIKEQEKLLQELLRQVRGEPNPDGSSIFDYVYKEDNKDKGRDTLASSIGIDYSAATKQHFEQKV